MNLDEKDWLDTFVKKSLNSLKDLEDCFHVLDKEISNLKTQLRILYAVLTPVIVYLIVEWIKKKQ